MSLFSKWASYTAVWPSLRFKITLITRVLRALERFSHLFWTIFCHAYAFDPVNVRQLGRGGNVWKNSPKIRFHLFKPKLWKPRLQKIIIICWHGSWGMMRWVLSEKMGGGSSGSPQWGFLNVEKNSSFVYKCLQNLIFCWPINIPAWFIQIWRVG